MCKSLDLTDIFDENITIDLKPGSVLVIYTDKGPTGKGPTGMCGQSMNVTCPHTIIHWFPNKESFRLVKDMLEYRQGKNFHVKIVVIGEWSNGMFNLIKHN